MKIANVLGLRALLVVTAALASVASFSQEHPSGKQMLLGQKIFTAFSEPARAELKITPAQFQKMQDAFEGQVQVDGDKIMVQISGSTSMEDMSDAALKVLTSDQVKRLDEIWLQQAGAAAILDKKIGKALGVSSEVITKAESIADKAGAEMIDLMQGGHDEGAMKEMKKLRDGAIKKIEDLLTADQKKKLDEMKGKPFERKKKG